MTPIRAGRSVALAAVLLACPLTVVPAEGADGPVPRVATAFTINLIARQSDRCLAISAGSTRNGASVIQWDCGPQPDQLWRLISIGGGYYHVRATHSGKCLSVADGGVRNGAFAVQWDCGSQSDQQWKLVQKSDGFFALVARHSVKCLSVYGGSSHNGASVIQWECGPQYDQQWKLA